MSTDSTSSRDDPLANGRSAALERHQDAAIRALLMTAGGASLMITLSLYLREGMGTLTLLGLGTLVMLGLLWMTHRRGHAHRVALGLVTLMLLAATSATFLNGSVRSAGVFVMFAAISIGGAFLTRRSLIVAGTYAIVALGVMNYLEQTKQLSGQLLPTGWTVWWVQAGVILVALISVLFGRNRLMKVVADQEAALEQANSAEAAARSSEGLFMGLFRNNPAATLVQKVDTRDVIDVNEAFVRVFGHSRIQLIGKPPPTLWADPADHLAFRALLQTEGRVHGMRAQGVRLNGSTFEMQIYAEFVAEGADRMVLSMVLDVSAEAASRHALEQSEERFSKAFNFSPLGMTITRMSDGRFVEVNPANERVLGYTRSDFLGKTSLEAGVWNTEQDRVDYIWHLKQEDRLDGYETRMRSKRGDVVPVRVWSETIEIDGEPCALAFTLNVAAEKQREALLIDMAQGVSGETGAPFFRSLVTHLGHALQADLVIAGEIESPEVVQTVAAFHAGEIVPNIRYELDGTPCARAILTLNGCYFAEHLSDLFPADHFPIGGGFQTYLGIALRDADGTAIGVLKALWKKPQALTPDLQALMTIFASRCNAELLRLRRDREIEKLQDTLEQRVEARTEQLEYLNRELDSFAYTVSHDLKSPLRSIGGFSHLLREQLDERMTDADRDLFDRVDVSVQRMNSLITDLLALARVSQGSLQRMNVNLSALAEDVIRQERHRDPTRAVQVKIAPGLMANCDARMAHIVLENLLGNAWKYTRQQPQALIEIGETARAPGQAPVFFVRDNGAGFDMSRADRLFKPFNRLHASNEFEGSGVGLATVRRILERHGGRIRGEGQVGQGSVFEFGFGSTE
jgi:PAS domain S-box-containing protein